MTLWQLSMRVKRVSSLFALYAAFDTIDHETLLACCLRSTRLHRTFDINFLTLISLGSTSTYVDTLHLNGISSAPANLDIGCTPRFPRIYSFSSLYTQPLSKTELLHSIAVSMTTASSSTLSRTHLSATRYYCPIHSTQYV